MHAPIPREVRRGGGNLEREECAGPLRNPGIPVHALKMPLLFRRSAANLCLNRTTHEVRVQYMRSRTPGHRWRSARMHAPIPQSNPKQGIVSLKREGKRKREGQSEAKAKPKRSQSPAERRDDRKNSCDARVTQAPVGREPIERARARRRGREQGYSDKGRAGRSYYVRA